MQAINGLGKDEREFVAPPPPHTPLRDEMRREVDDRLVFHKKFGNIMLGQNSQ
jgi:hypothetical protein